MVHALRQPAGTNTIKIAENSIHTIAVSGSGDVTMDLLEQVTTVSAAAASGNLVFDLSMVDPAAVQDYFVSVQTGSGKDRITGSSHDNQIDTLDEWLGLAALVTENGATAGFEFMGDTYIMEMGADALFPTAG